MMRAFANGAEFPFCGEPVADNQQYSSGFHVLVSSRKKVVLFPCGRNYEAHFSVMRIFAASRENKAPFPTAGIKKKSMGMI